MIDTAAPVCVPQEFEAPVSEFSQGVHCCSCESRQFDLRQNVMQHVAVYVGQPHVSTTVTVGEVLVVDAQLMQDRCPQIVHRTLVFDGVVPEFVSGAISRAALDSTTGQPAAETERVVIASIAAL